MGQKYQSQSASGYNSSPPPDDGSTVEANRITWAKTKTKLTDPIKTLADAINSAILAAFDVGTSSVVGAYDSVAADNGRILEVTGTTQVNLADVSVVGAGYTVAVKNAGTGLVTVTTKISTDTIDGIAGLDIVMQPGDYRQFRVNSAGNGYLQQGSTAALLGAVGQCQLQFVDATHIALMPYNGNQIAINGALYSIPAAGVTGLSTSIMIGGVAAQAVAATTLYLVYAFVTVTAGVPTIAFDLINGGSHSTDANTGVEIKTGDPSRTLVGMLRTDPSSHFTNAPFTISWFNRSPYALSKRTQTGAFVGQNFTNLEVDSSNRANFLCWASATLTASATGTWGSSTLPITWNLAVDSATPDANAISTGDSSISTDAYNYVTLSKNLTSEGLHYLTSTWSHASGLGGVGVTVYFSGTITL